MFSFLIKNRIFLTLFISFFVVIFLFVLSPFLHVLNKNIQNYYYSLHNTFFGSTVSENLVLVTIDKKTLESLGRFPFERDIYGVVLKNLKKVGVATVGFDILFMDKSNQEKDADFQKALQDFEFVTLGTAITGENTFEFPLNDFQDSSFSVGFLPPNIDAGNRVVYSFSPSLELEGKNTEHFTISILRSFYSYLYDIDLRSSLTNISQRYYQVSDKISLPFSAPNSNEVLIHFLPKTAFKAYSFQDIYEGNIENTEDFQDSIVLIGVTVDGIKDEFFTPNGLEYGIYSHANILNTILTKNFLVYFDKKLEWILLFLLITIGTYFNLSYTRGVVIMSNLGIFVVFILFLPLGVFLFTNLIMNLGAEMLVALILSLTLSNGIKYFIEDINKTRLKKSLSEYVGSNIADEVLENSGKINFDGEEKKAVLFFSDIEGFTTMSEEMLPKELVAFLRDYLSQMSHIILDEKGYINKYEGDAIMALWGAFTPLEQESYIQACRVALTQMRTLERLNMQWKDYYGKEIHIRIGLHAGEVIVGNIGAVGRKMEFTALGDTVNLASRLEGVNKYYGTRICVSETVYQETKEHFSYRFLDTIRVKGKKETLSIYELLAEKDALSEEKRITIKQFMQAQELYFKRDFLKAQEIFSELAEVGDPPSLTFKARCSMYLLEAPPEDWDGVWNMEEK